MSLPPGVLLPAAIHLLAVVLLILDVEPVPTFFYSLAWWSYIWAVSAVNSSLGRNSLLFEDRKTLLRMALVSIPVWLFFEACNFRLANWSYIGVPAESFLRLPGYPLAFATVLPGIFETRTLLANLGLAGDSRGPMLRITPGVLVRFVLLGVLMTVAPLLWPRVYFPLIWIGPILVLDPILYRMRHPASLLRAAERGEYTETIRLLAAGLICGVLWESWNYWAGAKWIYSIPYFEFWHIFEMPLLGYLGFPVFALECWLIWHVLESLRRRLSAARQVLLAAGAALFSIAVVYGLEEWTILSYQVVLWE